MQYEWRIGVDSRKSRRLLFGTVDNAESTENILFKEGFFQELEGPTPERPTDVLRFCPIYVPCCWIKLEVGFGERQTLRHEEQIEDRSANEQKSLINTWINRKDIIII